MFIWFFIFVDQANSALLIPNRVTIGAVVEEGVCVQMRSLGRCVIPCDPIK